MRDLDAVVTLSSLLLPCQIDDPAAVAKTYDQQARLVFNVTGTPAISVPTGFTSSGIPLAMQIAGRAFGERDGLSDRAGLLRGGRHMHRRQSEKSVRQLVAAKAAAE